MITPRTRKLRLLIMVLAAMMFFAPPADAGELAVRTVDGFKGNRLYLPDRESPLPCVLVLHGSDGGFAGWSHVAAVMLAAHGFAAMPFSYSRGGSPWQAGDIVDVDLDDTEAALKWLRETDRIGCAKVGLYGASRGAEHALLLTSLLAAEGSAAQPDAVAVHAASDTITEPFVPEGSEREFSPRDHAWRWRGGYDHVETGSRIKIERYAGPLFLSHGEADELWSASGTRRIAGLTSGAAQAPEVHIFPGQGHVLDAATKNQFYQALFAFFHRHLDP